MMKPILAVAACALVAPTLASAQLLLGAQAGAALPVGEVESGLELKDELATAVPLELRAAWRVAPSIDVGLQGGYALAREGKGRQSSCAATLAECKQHLWRIAARGEYGFRGQVWRPHVAAALGWEWLVERWETASDNWDQEARSGPMATLEAGVDRSLARKLTGGAYVAVGLSRFRVVSVKGETAGYAHSDAGGIDAPGVHAWVGIGLRLTFEPFSSAPAP